MEKFNPEKVIWTDNKIENVLSQTGIYSNAAEVNPNADKTNTTIQNPYTNPGNVLTHWAYSEYIWTHFYPIGNGRLAAMIAGGIDKEVIQINEDTCWDGSPYGTLNDENGNEINTITGTRNAELITVKNQTGGSVKNAWKYFRGTDKNGNPAKIGSGDAVVGDEDFRNAHSGMRSISNQALSIDNSPSPAAVQNRFSMERMVEETFLGKPYRQRSYKSFVEVYLDFAHESNAAQNYIKTLDMETGIVTVEYDYEGHHFKRESFASYPDQAIVMHIESDSPLKFNAQLHTYHGNCLYEKISDNEIRVTASVTDANTDNGEVATVNAIGFEARMLLCGDGFFCVSEDNTHITVNGQKNAYIYIVGATNYIDYLNLDNSKPSRECKYYMDNIRCKTYAEIKSRHIKDFSALFNKTDLSLDSKGDFSDMPTEKRIRTDNFLNGATSSLEDAHKNGVCSTYSKGDNSLAVLEFNYGKYLLISGSRTGRKATKEGEIDIPSSQPLNLTGKWNAAFAPSWNGKYTININTEMNYWATQPLNISECERPLIDTLPSLAQSGSITAANQYAIYNDRNDNTYLPGDPWVMHHNYDLWRGTQPIDNATAGLWPTGGIWLLEHAWQYYRFNKDKEYLSALYPYMVGAAKFFTQFLVTDPQTGYLITAASCSPEQGGVQPGPAMDTQLIRNLYDMVRQASEILGKTQENEELLSTINKQMPSTYLSDEDGTLAPNLIDDEGVIKEWVRGDVSFDIGKNGNTEWTVTNPFTGEVKSVYRHEAGNKTNHKHCSHLWELYPGTHLSAYSKSTSEQKIFEAFRKSTEIRSTGTTGWSLAWRIALNARALNGNIASKMLEQLLTTRTSPNLFDQHPNFQIDGNYGVTAGIIEMLVQSHSGEIAILPSVPDKWHGGKIKGINTREDAVIDIAWKNSKPYEVRIHAKATKNLKLRNKYIGSATVYNESGSIVALTINDAGNLLTIAVEKDRTYLIKIL